MFSRMLVFGIAQAAAPAEDPGVSVAEDARLPTAAKPKPVPWNLLVDRRLEITSEAGTTREGIFLGLEDGAAILEADDGTLISIAQGDVTSVRTVKVPPPTPTIPTPRDSEPLSFRQAKRLENERLAGVVRGTSIGGAVVSSLSAAASLVAEGFNVARWSLSKPACGETYDYSYYGASDPDELCGWTDGTAPRNFTSYSGYDNIAGITGASTIAATLHFGGLLTLVPSTMLRNRSAHRARERRHFAAWALWGAGIASFTANQAVAWTQNFRVRQICDDAERETNCRWITPTRGLPPGMYLLSAGLTLSSAILGLIDGRSVVRSVERGGAEARARPSIGVFPVSMRRGGGLGFAGRF